MFQIGQKVVCVADKWAGGYGDEIFPQLGGVYTVRGIDLHRLGSRCLVGLWLREIHNEKRLYARGIDEASFGADQFRPLIERKTDISIFKKMLTPKRKERVE